MKTVTVTINTGTVKYVLKRSISSLARDAELVSNVEFPDLGHMQKDVQATVWFSFLKSRFLKLIASSLLVRHFYTACTVMNALTVSLHTTCYFVKVTYFVCGCSVLVGHL